jgi:hypothetical protein
MNEVSKQDKIKNIFKKISSIKKLLNNSISIIIPIIKSKNYDEKSLNLIKKTELIGKNRKGILNKINQLLRNITNSGKRSGNGTDETIRLKLIAENINNKTELGIKMQNDYYKQFNKHISRVEIKGNKKNHYDLFIHNTDGSFYRCEEKGTKTYSKEINSTTCPYENSVEFYNGPAHKFSISKSYLKFWYDSNVDNQEIKTLYNLPNIPTFDDWLLEGPYCMLDPKGNYSKTLKQNYREKHGAKYSMGGSGKHNNPIDYRLIPNSKFTLSEEDKKLLIKEVQEIYNNVMNEKDIWLQTTGIPIDSFSYCWYDKIEPKIITDVNLIKNKKDIIFEFKLKVDKKLEYNLDKSTSFTGIMRWGKGCGFSCFRMDFK